MQDKFKKITQDFFSSKSGKLTIGAILGFLTGVLIILIGFFRVLFLAICTLLGVFTAGLIVKDAECRKIAAGIAAVVTNLFSRKRR